MLTTSKELVINTINGIPTERIPVNLHWWGLFLCGNIETGLLTTGPKEEIYENTRKILTECKNGGGLVLGTSNASMPETPAENYQQIIYAWEKFGKY